MLEKTLESPLDSKEIQPVNPKGNQSWMFTGRTDAEAETPILWLPDAKNWKRPWCWERLKVGGEGDDRWWAVWIASLTQTWIWASTRSWWWTGKPGVLQSMRSQRVGHNWAIELNWRRMPGIWQVVDKALIELSPLPNIFGVQCSQLEKITVNKMNWYKSSPKQAHLTSFIAYWVSSRPNCNVRIFWKY